MLETYFAVQDYTKEDHLIVALLDQEARLAFTLFSIKEYSVENLLCLFCIWQYRYLPSVNKMKAIYETFLEGETSPLEVNIPRQILDPFYKNYYSRNTIDKNKPRDRNFIFDGILAQIFINISDTFSRFQFDKLYERWSNNKKWKEEREAFERNVTTNVLVTAGATMLLGPAVIPLLSTVIGFQATKKFIEGGITHFKKKKEYTGWDLVKDFKKIGADRDFPLPRLPWDPSQSKILAQLNTAGFDMTVAGYPKKPRGLGKF